MFSFRLIVFKLHSNDFRNIGSLNNVTPQYLRTGKSSDFRPSRSLCWLAWFETYCRTNAAVGKNAFCQLDGETNTLGEYRRRLDRLNVFGHVEALI